MAKKKTLNTRAKDQGIRMVVIPKPILMRVAKKDKEFLRVQNQRRKKLGLKQIKF